MKIEALLELLKGRKIPMVTEDTEIPDMIEVVTDFPHSRIVYVVDSEGRFTGTVSIGSILRHVYSHHYEGSVHGHGILRSITATRACDLMDGVVGYANPGDDAEEVLELMASSGVKETAVVDGDMKLIGDITAVDLLRHHYEAEG